MAPQNVFDHCAQTHRRRNWNLVTFNINLCSIKKGYFWFPRLSGVTMATSLSVSNRDFLKLSFHMFPYNEILKVFKSKIWIAIWKKAPQNTSKYQISAKSVRGLGSYEHLKFRSMHQLKYRLWRHNDVIVVTSQFFLTLCRIHQAWHLCQISWSSEQ